MPYIHHHLSHTRNECYTICGADTGILHNFRKINNQIATSNSPISAKQPITIWINDRLRSTAGGSVEVVGIVGVADGERVAGGCGAVVWDCGMLVVDWAVVWVVLSIVAVCGCVVVGWVVVGWVVVVGCVVVINWVVARVVVDCIVVIVDWLIVVVVGCILVVVVVVVVVVVWVVVVVVWVIVWVVVSGCIVVVIVVINRLVL